MICICSRNVNIAPQRTPVSSWLFDRRHRSRCANKCQSWNGHLGHKAEYRRIQTFRPTAAGRDGLLLARDLPCASSRSTVTACSRESAASPLADRVRNSAVPATALNSNIGITRLPTRGPRITAHQSATSPNCCEDGTGATRPGNARVDTAPRGADGSAPAAPDAVASPTYFHS